LDQEHHRVVVDTDHDRSQLVRSQLSRLGDAMARDRVGSPPTGAGNGRLRIVA
jgi:hypothetical protein